MQSFLIWALASSWQRTCLPWAIMPPASTLITSDISIFLLVGILVICALVLSTMSLINSFVYPDCKFFLCQERKREVNWQCLHLILADSGSSGWQSPEQLLHGRQTRAVDLFSLGCVIFYCITGGSHPFGTHLERDINIVRNKMDLFLVEHIPEAVDLLIHLLNPDPVMRYMHFASWENSIFWLRILVSETIRSFSCDIKVFFLDPSLVCALSTFL